MSFYGVKQMACILCGARFPLVSGALVHPADIVCNACVLDLWDRRATEPVAAITAACAARLQPRMGMMPDTLAVAVMDRIGKLDEFVKSRDELENMLARRGVLGG